MSLTLRPAGRNVAVRRCAHVLHVLAVVVAVYAADRGPDAARASARSSSGIRENEDRHAGARLQRARSTRRWPSRSPGCSPGSPALSMRTHANFAHPSYAGVLFSTQVGDLGRDRRAPLAARGLRSAPSSWPRSPTISPASRRSRNTGRSSSASSSSRSSCCSAGGLAGAIETLLRRQSTHGRAA